MCQKPGQIMPHHLRHAMLGRRVKEGRLAPLPERLVDMARRTRPVGRVFRHEGDRQPRRMGHLLDPVLGDRVEIRRRQRLGIADIDLVLPRLGLALGILDRNARAIKPVAHGPHQMLFLRGAEDAVVVVVAHDRRHPPVTLVAQRIEPLLEDVELELGRHHGVEPHRLGPRHLPLQHRPRGMRHLLVRVMVKQIAHHHRRPRQPGNQSQCAQIRLVDIVAIACGPIGRLVTGHRRHIHVDGKQIVAAMRLVPAAIDEMGGMEPLAHQAPLHVDHAGQHRIDCALGHQSREFVKRQKTGHRLCLSSISLGRKGHADACPFHFSSQR